MYMYICICVCIHIHTHECDLKEPSSVVWPTAWKTNSRNIKGWADPASLIQEHRGTQARGQALECWLTSYREGLLSPRPDAGAGHLHSNAPLQSGCSESQNLASKQGTDFSGKIPVRWDESTHTISAFSSCGDENVVLSMQTE